MSTKIPDNFAPFSLQEVVSSVQGELLSESSSTIQVRGVSTDSRANLSGKVFVALRGERFDAHDYLESAVASGARILVVERGRSKVASLTTSLHGEVAVVAVSDTLLALGQLAAFHRARWGGKLCCVVGSAGKTTTRTVISALLSACRPGRVHGTVGNLNNRIGVPMVLLGLEAEHELAVVELGTNQPGEVAALAQMARPDVAVLTLIDLEHTEGLGDLDGVEKEEGSVFSHMKAGGVRVGFGEDQRVLRALSSPPAGEIVSYGFSHERAVTILERKLTRTSKPSLGHGASSDLAASLRIRGRLRTYEFQSSLIGRPGALAAAAGISVAEILVGDELDDEICARALAQVGEPGRNQAMLLAGERFVIDDSYNSNPASVASSVTTGEELAQLTGGRLWLVLGEMLELGALSHEEHRRMGQLAAQTSATGTFFIQGDARLAANEAKNSSKIIQFFQSSAEVAPVLAPLLEPGDVVVVKASRGVRAERVVEGLASYYRASASVRPGAKLGDLETKLS